MTEVLMKVMHCHLENLASQISIIQLVVYITVPLLFLILNIYFRIQIVQFLKKENVISLLFELFPLQLNVTIVLH